MSAVLRRAMSASIIGARQRGNSTRFNWPFTREAMLDTLLASEPRFVAFDFPFSTCKTTYAFLVLVLRRSPQVLAYIY